MPRPGQMRRVDCKPANRTRCNEEASQKSGGLRFRTTSIDRAVEAVEQCIRHAVEESWTVCEVWGEHGTRTMSSTQCEMHSVDQARSAPGVIVRAPGAPRQ